MKQYLKSQSLFLIALGLIALGAIGMLLYSTPEGLGLSDDSIGYIAGARSILSGQGYREAWLASNGPVTHFPPGFSSLLALISLSGLDPLRSTRFLNALLFGANSFLLGIIGWRMTKSQVAGVLLALLFAVNASLFNAHAVAMSEPLYIFFSLTAFLTFSGYFSPSSPSPLGRGKGEGWLITTGILTSFAYLTRYAGLALLATFLLALILLHDTWKKRLTNAAIFVASMLPFMIGWGTRNKIVADNATNRTLVYHPLSTENIETGIYNISEFLIPVETWRRTLIKIPDFFFILIAIIILVLLVWVVYKGLKKFLQPATKTPEILSFTNGLYIFGYLASIFTTMMLFDASTKFKLRILSPVYVSLLILLVYFGYWLWQRRNTPLRGLVVFLTMLILALSLYDTSNFVTRLHKGGQGYASFKWYDFGSDGFPESTSRRHAHLHQPAGTRLSLHQPPQLCPARSRGRCHWFTA